jgi:protein phosphatase 2C
MASAGVNNVDLPVGPAAPAAGAEGADHAAECRPTRRRRLAPVEGVANTSAGTEEKPPSSDADASTEGEAGSAAVINVAAALLPGDSSSGLEAAGPLPVRFGSVALMGRLRKMEDTVSLHPSFCVWAGGEPMHFFGVFDGHGGPHVRHLPVFTPPPMINYHVK